MNWITLTSQNASLLQVKKIKKTRNMKEMFICNICTHTLNQSSCFMGWNLPHYCCYSDFFFFTFVHGKTAAGVAKEAEKTPAFISGNLWLCKSLQPPSKFFSFCLFHSKHKKVSFKILMKSCWDCWNLRMYSKIFGVQDYKLNWFSKCK